MISLEVHAYRSIFSLLMQFRKDEEIPSKLKTRKLRTKNTLVTISGYELGGLPVKSRHLD